MPEVTKNVVDEMTAQTRLLTMREVQRMTGLSRYRIKRLEHEGSFPARRQAGGRPIGWAIVDVVEWVKNLPVEERVEAK